MTTAVSAKTPRRNGKATNLIHVPVIFGNQLLPSWSQSRFGSYAKMTCGDLVDGISPGGFFYRLARRLLVTLHSTSILRICSFSFWPQVPARNPNQQNSRLGEHWSRQQKTGAQRQSVVRTTLTGADEPYNGQAVRATITHLILICSPANCA
jgi:hypothetical protein